MNFDRRQFLRTSLASTMLLPFLDPIARAAATGARKLIVVMARGAWDVTFGLDAKDPRDPDVLSNIHGPWYNPTLGDTEAERYDRDETIETYGSLSVPVNPTQRPAVGDFYAQWADRCVVANGIAMGSIVHDLCRLRILTGTRRETAPDLAAITGAALGADAVIGYIDFAGQGFAGPLASTSLRVGNSGQLKTLIDPDSSLPAPRGASTTYPLFQPSGSEDAAIQAYLDAREARARSAWSDGGAAEALLDDLATSREGARALRDVGPEISGFLSLGQEMTIGDQASFALKMLGDDLCRAVLINSGLPWDTHTNNHNQHSHFNALFSGLSSLCSTLESSGQLDETMIVVLSEFTRTPRLNADLGKDHWPVASALFIGGGLNGGRSIGATDSRLDAQPVNLSTGEVDEGGTIPDYAHLAAGLLDAMGVDTDEWMPGVEVFSALSA